MALPVTSLHGRRIIVGVSGSIAAYKAVLLVRLLVKAGAEVRVLMTPAATKFVAPLTFSTLSKHDVLSSVTSEQGWNNHVELGLWADAYIIAPATANTLAQLANGLCNSVLAAVYLSARCPVMFAPAMDVDMWLHPATQANIARLESFGNSIIPVGEGELASGLNGAGRLAEPEDIVSALLLKLAESQPAQRLLGKRILVTAGPTHEAIDPVRFIGNHSSGKTGLALTQALVDEGAIVELVLGPATAALHPQSQALLQHSQVQLHRVTSAVQMQEASQAVWPNCDAAVLAAAVADYRPATSATQKIKKAGSKGSELSLKLVENPDIAASLGASKSTQQVLMGFALETNNAEQYARAKLQAKKLDVIALNHHSQEQSAFGGDHNAYTLFYATGEQVELPRAAKTALAQQLVAALVDMLDK